MTAESRVQLRYDIGGIEFLPCCPHGRRVRRLRRSDDKVTAEGLAVVQRKASRVSLGLAQAGPRERSVRCVGFWGKAGGLHPPGFPSPEPFEKDETAGYLCQRGLWHTGPAIRVALGVRTKSPTRNLRLESTWSPKGLSK
jgi:hypothetical protein